MIRWEMQRGKEYRLWGRIPGPWVTVLSLFKGSFRFGEGFLLGWSLARDQIRNSGSFNALFEEQREIGKASARFFPPIHACREKGHVDTMQVTLKIKNRMIQLAKPQAKFH